MADLVKIFYEVGETYKEEVYDTYNQTDSKKIDKIITIDIADSEYKATVYDKDAIVDRFFLRVTSSSGGNLYPFIFLSDKIVDGLKKSFKNMKKYLDLDDINRLKNIEKLIDYDKLLETIKEYQKEKNIYLGLMYEGKTFNELFPQVIDEYISTLCKGEVEIEGHSYIGGKDIIGFDAKLNFCSVNELPNSLKKTTKYRVLPLSKKTACLVKQGFEKIFEENIFRFSLFGHTYYLLPTIFTENKRVFFDRLEESSKGNSSDIRDKYTLERRLERLVKKLEESKLHQKILFSFLFTHKSNNAIELYQMIEDVAPSRISVAKKLMMQFYIESINYSKYIKKSDYDSSAVYIRDYIDDSLLLAKFIFGKESIPHKSNIESIISKKILFGSNAIDNPKREFSKVISGYFKDDSNFEKHQRFIDFLSALNALMFDAENLIYMEVDMQEYSSFSDMAKEKFKSVELLQNKKAQEFYTIGALTQLVMSWQYAKGSDALSKYIDSIGSINMQNIDRVFRKVYEASRKYSMGGKEYDDVMRLYVDIKESITKNDTISIDQANIAFVMGSMDYKEYKEHKKDTVEEEE